MARGFFVRHGCRYRRFTGGKFRCLQETNGGKAVAGVLTIVRHSPRRDFFGNPVEIERIFASIGEKQKDGIGYSIRKQAYVTRQGRPFAQPSGNGILRQNLVAPARHGKSSGGFQAVSPRIGQIDFTHFDRSTACRYLFPISSRTKNMEAL